MVERNRNEATCSHQLPPRDVLPAIFDVLDQFYWSQPVHQEHGRTLLSGSHLRRIVDIQEQRSVRCLLVDAIFQEPDLIHARNLKHHSFFLHLLEVYHGVFPSSHCLRLLASENLPGWSASLDDRATRS